MEIDISQLLAVIGGAAALVTGLWHAAMYVGKLTVRVDRHEDRLNSHDRRLEDHDEDLRLVRTLR